MGDAISSKSLQPQILQLCASMHHTDLYVRRWGAQNLPMKLEHAPSPFQRIHTCRHAVFAKHGAKRSKFREEHAKQVPCAAIWIPLSCSFRSHWVDSPHCQECHRHVLQADACTCGAIFQFQRVSGGGLLKGSYHRRGTLTHTLTLTLCPQPIPKRRA